MTSTFFESFLSAGLTHELQPHGFKKNLLCGIKELALVKGDIEKVKQKIMESEGAEAFLKWVRFLTLSEEENLFLAINYSHPQRNLSKKAVYDLELVRSPRGTLDHQIKPMKGVLIHTVTDEDDISPDSFFE